ncbi:hypothetical protein D0Z08_04800 [Nocardioides immobilis]|uniref:Peptidase M23 domain-containing protein n=1 Tax=Nocardioides immobilis TaxID=2049295 RepID=A0A417Y6L3_9ACTN|nr:peptidoglycan DD-metalloendopeptidase family protein [Nocardioides immobilis]RHW28299.1 hypothetical protein D0Z08_04800 [Nocardioides immobilis]
MKKLLALALPALVVLMGLPIIAAVMVTMSTQGTACDQQPETTTSPLGDPIDLGVVDGPVGGPVKGKVGVAAGPADARKPTTTRAETTSMAADTLPAAAPASDVQAALMRLRFADSYPTMTAEQARNAVTIAQVARDLEVPRYGLEVAIAAAIQESKLVNRDYGDRDSLGLFQQRPSTGWGTREQIAMPRLAAEAFFGEAEHTNNAGLLDIPGWGDMSLTEAAQAVQRSGFPGGYAEWETVAADVADLVGGDLPDLPEDAAATEENCQPESGTTQVTIGTFNVLGASHTDGDAGHGGPGGQEYQGYPAWNVRLPRALDLLEQEGVTVAGLQEVHAPQENALARNSQWDMWPTDGKQNKVVWDPGVWEMTDARLVPIPYFSGTVGMPLVQLTSTGGAQQIWVWSIHNPAFFLEKRKEALRRQLDTLTDLNATGAPVFIVGDFNDGKDGQNSSHCQLTPAMSNAFGGSVNPCRSPKSGAPIDHIYGGNVTWAQSRVDASTRAKRISDHPLVVASTVGSNGCPPTGSPAEQGLSRDALLVLRSIDAQFGAHTYLGVGERASNPDSDHSSGRAVDVMIEDWQSQSGIDEGDRIADWVRVHAEEFGVSYVIWRARMWSVGDRDWRSYSHPSGGSDPTLDHMDHLHVSVYGTAGNADCGAGAGEVVYPVPASLVGTDNHNWHETGPYWSRWHAGTDYSVSCSTPVYAAHAGTIEIDTTQKPWAGPWLVKVSTGPGSLTTWYAHMQEVTVSRGQRVAAGQQIGEVGQEGNVSGCHLHFEVHERNGSIYGSDNVDPSTWLAEHIQKAAA